MAKINLILLGDNDVGKTALVYRYLTGEFSKTNSALNTVKLHIRKIHLGGKEINIFIFDTSAKGYFYDAIVQSYYRLGDGVLLVYDVTNPDSFDTVSKLLDNVREKNKKAQILIAGNKSENLKKKAVPVSMVKDFAERENLEHMEMSALSGVNVEEAFEYLAKKVLFAKGIITRKPQYPINKESSEDSELKVNVSNEEDRHTDKSYEDRDTKESNRNTALLGISSYVNVRTLSKLIFGIVISMAAASIFSIYFKMDKIFHGYDI